MEYIQQIPTGPLDGATVGKYDVKSRTREVEMHTKYPLYAVSWNDALAAAVAYDGKYIITSPNMSFVPEPPAGRIEVRVKTDGKFGTADPLHWPQLYSDDPKINFMLCIPRDGSSERRSETWTPLNDEDYDVYDIGNVEYLATLKTARLESVDEALAMLWSETIDYELTHAPSQQLRWLVLGAQLARDRLSHPGSRRDLLQQLVCVERHYCLTLAWLQWRKSFENISGATAEPKRDLMGCFTTNAEVAGRLCGAGIPVWYLRLANTLVKSCGHISTIVDLSLPSNITTTNRSSSVMLYVGPPGPKQLEAIYHKGHVCADVEAVPLPDDYGSDSCLPPSPDAQLAVASTSHGGATSGAERAEKDYRARAKPCEQPVIDTNEARHSILIIPLDRYSTQQRERREDEVQSYSPPVHAVDGSSMGVRASGSG